jgi:hypothetical protein
MMRSSCTLILLAAAYDLAKRPGATIGFLFA